MKNMVKPSIIPLDVQRSMFDFFLRTSGPRLLEKELKRRSEQNKDGDKSG